MIKKLILSVAACACALSLMASEGECPAKKPCCDKSKSECPAKKPCCDKSKSECPAKKSGDDKAKDGKGGCPKDSKDKKDQKS